MSKTLEAIIQMGGKLDPSLEKAVNQASQDLEKLGAVALKANQKAELAAASTSLRSRQKTEKAQMKAMQTSQKIAFQESLAANKSLSTAQRRQYLNEFELAQKKDMIDLETQHSNALIDHQADQTKQMEYYNQLADAAEKAAGKAAFSDAGKSIQDWGKKIETAGASIKKVGKWITTYITAPLMLLGGKSYGLAKEYESELMQVMKVAEGTDEQYESFQKKLLGYSETMPLAYQELLAGAASGARMGIPIDELDTFTVVMAKLDTATDLSAESASESVAKIQGVLGVGTDSLSNMGSAIVELGNNFATNESNIVDYTYRMMATAGVLNMAASDVMGFSAALHASGIEAEAGGSAWSKLMKKMEVAAQVSGNLDPILEKTGLSLRELELMSANSSKDFKGLAQSVGLTSTELSSYLKASVQLEDYAKLAGVTSEQFKALWAQDPTELMLRFTAGLGSLGSEDSAVAILQDMGLTEVRLSNAILAAANAQDIFRESIETSRKAWDENTALDKEYEMFASTTESADKMLANKTSNVLADYGENVASFLEPIKSEIGEAITAFGNLDEKAQDVLVGRAFTVAAGGGLLWALGSAVEKAGSLVTGLGKAVTFFGAHPAGFVAIAGMAAVGGTWWLVNEIMNATSAVEELQTQAASITLGVDEASKNAVLEAIDEIAQKLEDLNSPEAKQAQKFSNTIKAGYGDEEMFTKAIAYEQALLSNNQEAITGAYSEQIVAAQERMAEATAAGNLARADQEKALIDGLRAELPLALQDANIAYTESISALVEGMLSQYGDLSTLLAQMGGYYQAASLYDVDAWMQKDLDERAALLKTFPDELQKAALENSKYASFDEMAAQQSASALQDAYTAMTNAANQGLANYVTPEALGSIGNILAAVIEGSGGELLDPTALSGVILDAFALMDYANANSKMLEAGAFGTHQLPQFMDSGVLTQMQAAASDQSSAASSLSSSATNSQTAASRLITSGDRLISAASSLNSVQPTFNINFAVPGMATGGTVTAPTFAMVGEGRDDETIVPHNDSPRSKSLLGVAAAGVGMSLGGGANYTFAPQITISGNADEDVVAKALDDAFEEFKAWANEMEAERERVSFG